VELAVCLPVLALVVFGSIEACSMMFLRQTLCAAAYEGIRVAMKKDGTNAEASRRCQEVLAARNVQRATVAFQPADVSAANRGTALTITVSAPCDANRISPAWFYQGMAISVGATMVKE
jgi:Flp pilus assembly protein TadG